MELVWANTGDIFARGKVVKKTMYIYIVNLHCCTIYGVKSTLKIRQVCSLYMQMQASAEGHYKD